MSLVVAVSAMVAGCSDSEEDPQLRAAQARVESSQQQLADAQDAAADAAEEFCARSVSYLQALDRYGDVLHETTPTVGDVRDAGTDLENPEQRTVAAAEDAAGAREDVAAAQRELTEAKAELADLQGSPAPAQTKDPDKVATESVPKVSNTTINRVRQAEEELDAALAEVTDSTPLAQAGETVNAAAVAMEMTWLGLFTEVGCLDTDQQAQAYALVADYTRSLQQALKDGGYYTGPVDGVYGEATVSAVRAVQEQHGLPVTGTLDKATEEALRSDLAEQGADAEQQAVASTAAVQQTLKLAGWWTGPVDGEWTPELTEALKEAQTELGVTPTGTVDAATVAALERTLSAAGDPPDPEVSTTPSPSSTAPEPSAPARSPSGSPG